MPLDNGMPVLMQTHLQGPQILRLNWERSIESRWQGWMIPSRPALQQKLYDLNDTPHDF